MRLFQAMLCASVLLAAPAASAAATTATTAGPDVATLVATTAATLHADALPRLHGWHASLTGKSVGLPGTDDSWLDLTSGANADYAHLGAFGQDNGFDGTQPWTRDDKGVVWAEGSAVGRAQAVNDAYRRAYTLWRPGAGGATVTSGGTLTDHGTTFDLVHVSRVSSVPFDVWIARDSHLPTRVVETASGVTMTETFDKFAPVGGVLFPYFMRTVTQGNETVFTAQRIEADPPDLAAHVMKPQATVHDFTIAGANTTTVPFDLIDNHVYVNVMLNGKGPYRFIFDTGGRNVLDTAVAHEIGSGATGSMQGGGVGATTEEFQFARVASMKIGAADFSDQEFVVLPVRAGFATSGSANVDGLIGWEVLARLATTFDYARDTITFSTTPAPVLPSTIPFVYSGTQPEIACGVNGITSRCTVDTGSRSSLDFYRPFSQANPAVVPAQLTAPGVDGFGVGGPDIGRLGRLHQLDIAGFSLSDLVAGYSDATAGAFAGEGFAANLGGGVWKRFIVTFDYPHQTMSLVPTPALRTRDAYERAGFFALARGGKVVVVDVRAGTPAAQAGLMKGDAITSVNGSGDHLTLGTVRSATRASAGTVVRLGVQRGAAAPTTIAITLRDFV